MRLPTLRTVAVTAAVSVAAYAAARVLHSVLCNPPGIPSPPIPPLPGATLVDRYVRRPVMQHFYIVRAGESLLRLLHWTRMFGHRPFLMRIFLRQHIVISRAEDLEEVLLHQEGSFRKGTGYDLLRAVIGEGLLAMTDKGKHAAHRRILAPIFKRANLKGLSNEVMRVHGLRLLGNFFELLLRAGEGGTVTINLADYMNRMALSVIGEAAFRASREETAVVLDAFAVMVRFNKMNYFCPYLRTWSQKAAENLLVEVSNNLMERHDDDNYGPRQRVVLDALIEELYVHFDKRDVVNHLITFLFAGHDTTSTTMQFMCVLLARDHRVQERLYDELELIMPAACMCPTIDELLECEYLVAVLREAMRLYPAAPLIYRDSNTDVHLPASGVTVPKGTVCVLNIFGVHRCEDIYGADADAFRPERWLGGEGEALRQRCGRCGYMPFSVGKRNCIGQEYGYYEVLVVVALLIRHLRLDLVGAFPRTRFQFTLTSPDPFRVKIALREEIGLETVSKSVGRLKTALDGTPAMPVSDVKVG